MSNPIHVVCKGIEAVMAVFLLAMVVLVFGNVVLRYGFNSSITFSEEMSRMLFVWLCFMAAVVAMRERSHLGSDMVVSRLPPLGKKICFVAGHLLMLFITWLLFEGSLEQATINLTVVSPVMGMPMAIFYATGLFFSVGAAILLLTDLWRLATGSMQEKELVAVKESEEQAELEAIQAQMSEQGAINKADRNGGVGKST